MTPSSVHFLPLPDNLARHQKPVFFRKNQIIFLQGGSSDSIFYIESGAVKLTFASSTGKEACIGLLKEGELFGESCLASANPVRFHTATAVTDLRLLKITRISMLHILRTNPDFASALTSYLVHRNEQIQEDLADSLLSSTEERLAQVLSRLKTLGAGHLAPVLTQQDLASMVGASRQRVNVLMQRRRRSGQSGLTYDK
ncbi:MAG TPA: Crp/Fnr family transcriptional regulator [Terriglobales bacterium]|nr:Crp/Fnr family transcriptional regulator [Terriglobales bacterium]